MIGHGKGGSGERTRVRISLVPQEHQYFGIFSEMGANVEAAGKLLLELMEDYDDAKSKTRSILEHEHVGDKLVHDVVKRLNSTFITPLDREDIYDLAATLDEILDNIEAAADMMMLYRISAPTEYSHEQAKVIAAATAALRIGIDGLEKRGDKKLRDALRDCFIEVNRLENDGDRIAREAIAGLFDGDMKATDIIKWKDVYETLESAIDECEHVANIIESIILKHA
jgi:predicted phosphate transport protein (TIGR00153 family)